MNTMHIKTKKVMLLIVGVLSFGINVMGEESPFHITLESVRPTNRLGQVNVALNTTVTPLTNVQLGSPQDVVDGDFGTAWYSYQGGGDTISFTLDMGREVAVGRCVYFPTQTETYLIETSSDDVNWTSRHSGTLDYYSAVHLTNDVFGAYAARYFRYTGQNSKSAYVGVIEFQVFEMESGLNNTVISFPTSIGGQYSVECTTNLAPASWTLLDGVTLGDGSEAFVTNHLGTAPSMFLRVLSVAQDLTSGLLARYTLDGDATDSTTYGNDGLAVGVEFVTNRLGVAGRACRFDSTDYIEIPDDPSLNISGPVSIAVWIKADQVGTTQMIFGKSNFTSTTDYILRLTPGGGIQWEYNMLYSATAIIPANEWTHVVVTAGDATLTRRTIYVNGVETAHTTSGTVSPNAVSNPAMMGAARYWSAPWSEHFSGSMDDLRIYDKELTLDEVQTLYSQEQ
jgi:hypothetical protein